MIKFLLILMLGCVIFLSILAIINSLRLYLSRRKSKKIFYHTPKLSELTSKEFSDYIDYLTRDL
ncbi:MAG: hypothetical protein J6N78_06210 [Clostridia bacterium]|nr:hypothetical protein [Clostridia bacterium]